MQQLIHRSDTGDSPADESADANLNHPEWCDTAECWAYENDAEDPAVGGFHLSRTITVPTYRGEISLQLTQDHGAHADSDSGQPYLQLTVGADDDGSTRHLTLDGVSQLYAALQVLIPSLINGNATREIFQIGERNGRRSERLRIEAEARTRRASDDTLAALERIQQRLNDAERDTYRAYCNGYVDALDNRAPEFGVTR